jgi:hypothetical protein
VNSLALHNERPASLPATYEAARDALAKCERIDECHEWANKALALAAYARQSRDDSLIIMAQKIQARAIRRCGELLAAVPSKKGQRGTSEGRTNAARDAGLSAYQQATAQRVAAIPAKKFEQWVERDAPAVTTLAQAGKGVATKRKPSTCCPTCGRPY